MLLTRRTAIKLLAAAVPGLKATSFLADGKNTLQIHSGSFKGTRESLHGYTVPEWFRDAKFGIWAHWGPQSAPEYGDWYARRMYMEGERQYKYHLEQYGHPSKFGFKDVIQTWKGDKFDPDYLVGLYKKAGAKYFVSMGVHHDNFDLWNSKHTRWNSVNMGPKKDIVGLFRKAALKHGLRFGVSEHLWIAYKWFSVSHGSDQSGSYAGIPYDGADSKYVDLYLDSKKIYKELPWNEEGIPESWKQQWFIRINDLVDKYSPDMLCTDGPLPFENWGLNLVAHLFNQSAKRHDGSVEAVYTSKRREDCEMGTCVLDSERGLAGGIWRNPWQTTTCIGNWHYNKTVKYKSPKAIIDLLVDIVSRNGNLLINFPLPNNGMLDAEELKLLDEITKWMAINGEAIYGTRPWKILGVGPNAQGFGTEGIRESMLKELTAEDVRFTTKGQTLYAFVMGWPESEAQIPSIGTNNKYPAGKVGNVELLGFRGKLQFSQNENSLKVELPFEKPCDYAVCFKIH